MTAPPGAAPASGSPAPGLPVRAARWIAERELWLFWLVAPLLLVPTAATPLAAAAVGLFWLCRRVGRGSWGARTPADPALAALLLAGLGGLAWSLDRGASMSGWWRLFAGAAAFWAIATGVDSGRRLRQWAWALLAACAGAAALTLLGSRWSIVRLASWPGVYDLLPGLLRDAEDGLGFHPRIMGMALATLLPIPLALAASPAVGRLRWAALALIPPMAALLALTQSIQAAFGVLAAVAALLIWRWRWAALLLPAAAALGWWAIRLPAARGLGERLLDPTDPLGVAAVLRLDMWRSAQRMLHDQPYTGIGLDSFPLVQSQAYPGYLIGPEPHAHNLYLQAALDLGLPGLLALLALLMVCGSMVARSAARLDGIGRALATGAGGGLVSAAASGLLDTFWTTKPALVLWIVLGTAAALSANEAALGGPGRAPSDRRWGRWINGAALGALLLVWLALPGGTWRRNQAARAGIGALVAARTGAAPAQLDAAAAAVGEAAATDPANADLAGLLAGLEAWRGDQAAALAAARERLRRDSPPAVTRYIPPGPLRRSAQQQGLKDDMGRFSVYNQWSNRFPERAEIAILPALAAQEAGDPALARALAQQALERGAEPQALVRALLAELPASP